MKYISKWFTEPYKKSVYIVWGSSLLMYMVCMFMSANRYHKYHTHFEPWTYGMYFFLALSIAINIVMMVKVYRSYESPFASLFGVEKYMSAEERKALISINGWFVLLMLVNVSQWADLNFFWKYVTFAILMSVMSFFGIQYRRAKKKREQSM